MPLKQRMKLIEKRLPAKRLLVLVEYEPDELPGNTDEDGNATHYTKAEIAELERDFDVLLVKVVYDDTPAPQHLMDRQATGAGTSRPGKAAIERAD